MLAQTITGRVVDSTTGKGIPGTTVLQLGTVNRAINGTSSDPDGYFTLPIPGTVDSVKLAFSAITYVSKDLIVAPGQNVLVRLMQGTLCYVESHFELAVASGIRYAPYGGIIKLNASDFLPFPLTATLNYQTNFNRNHALIAGLILPAFWQRRFITSEVITCE